MSSPLGDTLSEEHKKRYNYPQVRVIQPGGPYFKMPWERVYKVSIATQTINMAHDPDERYATCAELQDDLEKFLSAAAFRPQQGIIAKYMQEMFAEEIEEGTNILLARGWDSSRVLNEALVEAMRIVGIDFRDGILFVPEVLLAAKAMKAGMAILRPLLAETGAETIGTVVIGTVKGDIHDIGKNLVAMMLEGAGFEVIDLGINTDADAFINALDEHKPDILGMSALLTTTMPYMKVVIDTMVEKGIRQDYIVLVGGAPLNEEFGTAVGADAYCRDAAVAADTAKQLVTARRGAA